MIFRKKSTSWWCSVDLRAIFKVIILKRCFIKLSVWRHWADDLLISLQAVWNAFWCTTLRAWISFVHWWMQVLLYLWFNVNIWERLFFYVQAVVTWYVEEDFGGTRRWPIGNERQQRQRFRQRGVNTRIAAKRSRLQWEIPIQFTWSKSIILSFIPVTRNNVIQLEINAG